MNSLDRDLRRELRQPAEVVAVPVRDDQVIDLLQVRVFDRRHDAAGVAHGARRHVARIHEQRFAGRRDEKRRVAAFDVDYIDVEGLPRLALRQRSRRRQRQPQQQHHRPAQQLDSRIHNHLRYWPVA